MKNGIDVSLVVAAVRHMDAKGSEFSDQMVGGTVAFDPDREQIGFFNADGGLVDSISY